jgi:hypothetical protein
MAAVAERQQIENENVLQEEEGQAGPFPIDSLVVSVEIIKIIAAMLRKGPKANLFCFSFIFNRRWESQLQTLKSSKKEVGCGIKFRITVQISPQ